MVLAVTKARAANVHFWMALACWLSSFVSSSTGRLRRMPIRKRAPRPVVAMPENRRIFGLRIG